MSERRAPRAFGWLPLVLVALAALLAALAALQFRWTGELGEAERERLRAALEERTARTGDEFARALTTLYLALAPASPFALPEESAIASRLDAWRGTSPHPELVTALLRLETPRDVGTGEQLSARQYDPASRRWSDLAWPPTAESPLPRALVELARTLRETSREPAAR